MPEVRHLREEDFRSAFSIADYLESCDQAFQLYGRGEVINPTRSETATKDCFRLEMPAEWPGRYHMRKIIEERSKVEEGKLGQRQASILLEDLERGLEIRLDADHITDMRTGAAGALGIKYLARTPIARVALLGTGRIAQVLALAVDQLFDLEEVRATSRKAENRQAFQQKVGPHLRPPLHLAETLTDCIQGVDAVLTAVPTPRPILSMEQLKNPLWLAVMGGDGRTRQLEPEVLEQMGVVVDDVEQARKSGEFAHAQETERFDQIAFVRRASGEPLNIGDAACGRLDLAVESPRLAYFTGLAVQDLCAAVMIYERFRTTPST